MAKYLVQTVDGGTAVDFDSIQPDSENPAVLYAYKGDDLVFVVPVGTLLYIKRKDPA